MDDLHYKTRSHHSKDLSKLQLWKKNSKSKRRKSLVCDVTFNNNNKAMSCIYDSVNTHKYRRRLKGHCENHLYLYNFLRKCYENNLTDTELIRNIIGEVYLCEGNLHSIFSILLPGHVGTSYINIRTLYPEFSTKNNRSVHYRAFEFYLTHLCCVKISRHRFSTIAIDILNSEIDNQQSLTPLLAATKLRDPYLLSLLLRYGADPFCVPKVQTLDSESDPISCVVSGLNSIAIFKNTGLCEGTKAVLLESEKKLLTCLQLFYRATKCIPLAVNRHFVTHESDVECVNENKVYNLHPRLAECLDLPTMSGSRPLQHLCRFTVRKHLMEKNSSTSLPSLIEQLPLPRPVKAYLDLLSD